MTMQVQAKIVDKGFNRALADIRRHLGVEGVREQAGLLVLELVRRTPPLSVKAAKLSALQAARRAITRDLRRVVRPIQTKDWTDPSIKRAIRKKDRAAMEVILRRVRKNDAIEVVKFDPADHKRARSRATGRVPKAEGRAARWTLDTKEWSAYLKRLLARIGQLKATWVPAARAAGVLARVPSFVRRQKHFYGRSVDRLRDALFPSFAAVSHGAGVNRHVRHAARQALQGRAKAMVGRIRHELRKRATQHGMTVR